MNEKFYQEAVNVYKLTIQHQNDVFNLILAAIGIILAIIVIGNWVIFYKLMKKDLKNDIDTKLNKINEEYNSQLKSLIWTANNAQGDISGSYASTNYERENYPSALRHAFVALQQYGIINHQINIKKITKFILKILKKDGWNSDNIEENLPDMINLAENVIPELMDEKKEILQILNDEINQ